MRQAIRAALELLSRRDRRLLIAATAIQMATSLLDLVGVLLLGLVGALAVTTVQSQPPPTIVETVADTVGLGGLSDQALVGVLAGAAAIILLSKSVISSLLTRRLFLFLANRQAIVSARLTRALLAQPLTFLQRRTSQETAYALLGGATQATLITLGQLVIAMSEVSLLVILGVALLIIDPLVTLAAGVFFVLVALVLQRAMGGWASRTGQAWAQADIASLNAVQEALGAYREITVADRRDLYVDRIQALRWAAAKVSADRMFIQQFPKYMFEAALIVGAFALAAVLFVTRDSIAAVGTLALFLAAGTRVMPSLLRLQGAALTIRDSSAAAAPTFGLATDLGHPQDLPANPPMPAEIRARLRRGHPELRAVVTVEEVSVRYPGAGEHALDDVTLSIPAGSSVALVGASGAGKSTLADVILGVLSPDRGSVTIDGLDPAAAVQRWPGGIAYVPQEVSLVHGTVRDNVAIGLPQDAIDDELVWEALTRAHLTEFLTSRRDGLDTVVGEDGVRLSGGQRQRLGIARALYTRPKLLVLDEATSALDAETEASISAMIADLGGDVTTVIIAHRLSTVRDVDTVVFLEAGKVLAGGSFDDVRRQVPAMDRQATLMGL